MTIYLTPPSSGGGAASVPSSTTTVEGKVRLATTTEAQDVNNETLAVTPKALNAQINSAIVGGIEYKGSIDAANIPTALVNANQGDFYKISVANASVAGTDWDIGDNLIVNTDMGSTFDAAKIDKIDSTDADLATVATSGSYADLTNKPPIPTNSTDLGDTNDLVRTTDVASATAQGIVELATDSETATGTDSTRAVTPAGLSSVLGDYSQTLGVIPTASHVAAALNKAYYITASAGTAVTLTLPSVSSASAGDVIVVTRKNSGNLTIVQNGSDTGSLVNYGSAGGASSHTISNNGQELFIRFQTNIALGSNWFIFENANHAVATSGDYNDLTNKPTSDDITSDHTGVNYTGAQNASITTHLSGIDQAIANALGGTSDKIEEGQAKVEVVDTAGNDDATIQFWADPNNDGTSEKVWEFDKDGHLIPDVNATYDIGKAEKKVRHLFLSDNSLQFGPGDSNAITGTVSATSTHLQYKSVNLATETYVGTQLGDYTETSALAAVATSNDYNDLDNKPPLGTAAALDHGTGANQIVRLDSNGKLPQVDGSALTNLPSGSSFSTRIESGATVTAVANEFLFLTNNSSSGIDVTLPANPSEGDFVALSKQSSTNSSANEDPTGGTSVVEIFEGATKLRTIDLPSGQGTVFIVYDSTTSAWTFPTTGLNVVEDSNTFVTPFATAFGNKAYILTRNGDVEFYCPQASQIIEGRKQRIYKAYAGTLTILSYNGSATEIYDPFTNSNVASLVVAGHGCFVDILRNASGQFIVSAPLQGALLKDISNVNITNIQANQTLSWDGTNSQWINSTPSSGGASQLDGLSDVTISNAAVKQTLRHDGSSGFVNAQLAYSDLTGTPTLGTAAALDTGTGANQIVKLDSNGNLPAVDGSALTNVGKFIDYQGASSSTPTFPSRGYLLSNNNVTLTLPNSNICDDGDYIAITSAQAYSCTVELHSSDQPTDNSTPPFYNIGTGTSANSHTITIDQQEIFVRFNGNMWHIVSLNKLSELSEDTTPVLGGDLDVSTFDIVSSSNNNIELAANGTGVVKVKPNTTGGHLELDGDGTNAGKLRLMCQLNSHGIYLQSPPHSANANYTLTLPTALGNANDILQTDASGNLSWVAQSGGGGGSAPVVSEQNSTATLSAPASSGILEQIYTISSSSAVTLTLPSATSTNMGEGFKYQFKRLGSGDVTIQCASNEFIDHSGQTSFSIGAQYDSITLVANGTSPNPSWLLI